MFGYTADEIIGRPIRMIIPRGPAVRGRQGAGDDPGRAGGRALRNRPAAQGRHASIEISLSVSPVRARDGTVIGASKIARDISEQRRLARRAEEAARAKDEFLAMLSHELRTPLNAVLGYTRMLRDGRYTDERREQVIEIIERNARVLSQLVSDVLDVSSIVTGKVRLTLEACDLAATLRAAVDSVRPSADAKGVALRLTMPDEPVRARCDTDRMQQVFWNLLSNGVKFTPRGGVVTGDADRARRHDCRLRWRTRESASGPSRCRSCFSGSGRRRTCTPASHGGMGLGLALARHFMELHGGTISAEQRRARATGRRSP